MFARTALRRIAPARQLCLARRAPALCPRLLLPPPPARRFSTPPLQGPPDFVPPPPPPPSCPGCGAPSQRTDAALPGYYSATPSKRQRFGADNLTIRSKQRQREDAIWEQALVRLQAEGDPSVAPLFADTDPQAAPTTPVCARCHALVHHHSAPPLPSYPTLDTLTNLLLAARHETNHIYHLVDAADLPMSLVPQLRNHLYTRLPREITRGLSLSYVVTRADLLMRTEAQVRSLGTWVKKVLKDALPPGEKVEGRNAEDGVHIVSARRGWGVGRIKLETRHREGGVWVVGAVNVGKSRLVREVWPEAGEARTGSLEDAAEFDILPATAEEEVEVAVDAQRQSQRRGAVVQVPPTVSDIPGTTAAPIRVRFKTAGGAGKKAFGELVDLPGLERWIGFGDGGLLPFVRDEKRTEFGMEKLVGSQQYTIKPGTLRNISPPPPRAEGARSHIYIYIYTGQSMLIAGVILITPKTCTDAGPVVLAYPFTSLPVHVTSTRKALQHMRDPDPGARAGMQLFQKASAPDSPDAAPPDSPDVASSLPAHFASAGTYALSNTVTQLRNPFLPDKGPAALAALPYRVVATDLLLAGLGWVELVAQVRQHQRQHDEPAAVCVEVFTPRGKGVGQRSTMGADMLRKKGEQLAGVARKTSRPRRSMKGDKKRRKMERGSNAV